ncbi:MAG: outer membrane beta-barrel protein [Fimbriimonas sp.]
MALASLSSLAVLASADDAPKIDITGSLDIYYQFDFNKPLTGATVNGRQFDVRHNSFSFTAGQINFSKAVTKESPLGATLQLYFGPNADTLVVSDPGGDSLKNVLQGYVTYNVGGATVDFGKFLTWIGSEVVPAGDNANYSRSFLFTYGQPVYHVGLRASKPVGPFGVTAALVNGWNEAEDSNGGKTLGLSVSYVKGPLTTAVNYYGGVEGAGSETTTGIGFSRREVNMVDLVANWKVSDVLTVGLNADYADAKAKTSAQSGKWNGVAAYATQSLTEKTSVSGRWETFSDPNGLRTGSDSLLNSLTLTLSHAPAKDVKVFVEFRHDTANMSIFPKDGGILKDKRDTITFAGVFKF